MRLVANHPAMYGTPQAASGQIQAYAVVVLNEELGDGIAASCPVAYTLVTADVIRERSQGVELCDESRVPQTTVSYDAFTRHGNLFLDLLESHIERVRAAALWEWSR